MIKGMHGLFYTSEAEATRAFVKDKLGLPHVDAGDGWLIFSVPEAEFGIHPGEKPAHQISFWCDDLEATMKELGERGVEFLTEVRDDGYGPLTTFELPGGVPVQLYQPRHPQP